MQVPRRDPKIQYQSIKPKTQQTIGQMCESRQFIMGQRVTDGQFDFVVDTVRSFYQKEQDPCRTPVTRGQVSLPDSFIF